MKGNSIVEMKIHSSLNYVNYLESDGCELNRMIFKINLG